MHALEVRTKNPPIGMELTTSLNLLFISSSDKPLWRGFRFSNFDMSGFLKSPSISRTVFPDFAMLEARLIDRVVFVEAGKELRAIKNVSLAEEYLGDHFPAFPVGWVRGL